MMKNLILIFLFVATHQSLVASEPLLDSAEAHYNNNKYSLAINNYQSLIRKGYSSAALFYNLGNCYYRNQEIANSILYFEKALKLSPSDEDILHNLQLANQSRVDQFEEIPEVSWSSVLIKMNQVISANTLAFISILILIGAAVLFLLKFKLKNEKYSMYSIGGIITSLFTAFLSIQMSSAIYSISSGIILENNVQILSAPNANSTILLQVNEGTKLEVVGKSDQWIEIKTPANDKGWILREKLSEI